MKVDIVLQILGILKKKVWNQISSKDNLDWNDITS